LHLGDLGDEPPDVLPTLGRPLVAQLAHGRARRDGVDGDDLTQAMGHRGHRLVAVDGNGAHRETASTASSTTSDTWPGSSSPRLKSRGRRPCAPVMLISTSPPRPRSSILTE